MARAALAPLLGRGFDDFLFAPIGDDRNGTTLSVLWLWAGSRPGQNSRRRRFHWVRNRGKFPSNSQYDMTTGDLLERQLPDLVQLGNCQAKNTAMACPAIRLGCLDSRQPIEFIGVPEGEAPTGRNQARRGPGGTKSLPCLSGGSEASVPPCNGSGRDFRAIAVQ
jgi:hypothetical protein